MRLTVGPLPPVVYWRRRVVILGTLIVVIIFAYSCANASDAVSRHRKRVLAPTTGSPTAAATAPSDQGTVPPGGGSDQGGSNQGGGDPPVDPSQAAASATATPPADAQAAATGPCTDGEMALTVAATPASAARGTTVTFAFQIKNTANRTCTRDVGADPQELYLEDASKVKIWSSDTCDPRHGSDVRTFRPGDVANFSLSWAGRANNAGCANQQPPAAGTYRLLGRLATKLSDPSALELK